MDVIISIITNMMDIILTMKPIPRPILRSLKYLGEDIKLARLRRQLKASTIADRAGITRVTLRKIENGDPGVSIGNIAKVLNVLDLLSHLSEMLVNDELGREIQDSELPKVVRD